MIDPRGPRFAAWLTTVVLALVVLTASPWLLAAQAVVFALGSRGRSPYILFWKRFVRRGAPRELEDARPPRFAQVVGLAGAGTPLLLIATALALVAALLNAAFGICLGCELYLTFKKSTTKGVPA